MRCTTARGSSTGFSLVGPTNVKACKSYLFTEGSPEVENKEHLFDFVVTLSLSNHNKGTLFYLLKVLYNKVKVHRCQNNVD